MHFEGSFEVPAPREKVFAFVTDPRKLGTVLPDVDDLRVADESNFTVKAKVGISYLRGSISMKFQLTEKKEGVHVKLVGRGSGMQSSIDLGIGVNLDDTAGGGTKSSWVADASIGGLLASVGSRLMETVAEKYMKQITDSLRKKLLS